MAQKKKERISKNSKKIILKQIRLQKLKVPAKSSPSLKLEELRKSEKLEEKIEQFPTEQIPSTSNTSSRKISPAPAITTALQSSPSPEIETSARNYSERAKKYASQRAERQAQQETAPRVIEPTQTPYSTIVLYGGAKQQASETSRAYTPSESIMRRATQMANRLANRVPQVEISQSEMFENKMPDRAPQNAPEKVYYELAKTEEKKPKRRYPWEG
jgi:hypothetical protein